MDDTNLGSILSDQAEEQVEQTQTEVTDTGEQATPPVEQEDPVEKHRKGLEAAAAAERRRRQEAEQRAQQLERELQQYRQPAKQTELVRPRREEYSSQEEYEDAIFAYWDKVREQESRQEKQKQELQESESRFWKAVDDVIAKGNEKYSDFNAVVNQGLGPFLDHSQQGMALRFALTQIESGHEVAYWLGKNPADAQRVAQLPPPRMLAALGAIETRLSASPVQKPSLPQTLTQARDARGQFTKETYDGPTPLDDVLAKR